MDWLFPVALTIIVLLTIIAHRLARLQQSAEEQIKWLRTLHTTAEVGLEEKNRAFAAGFLANKHRYD